MTILAYAPWAYAHPSQGGSGTHHQLTTPQRCASISAAPAPLHRNASCDALSKNLNNRGDSGALVPHIGHAYHLFNGLFLANTSLYAWFYRLFS